MSARPQPCIHHWICIGMDRNDELHQCAKCGLLSDGHGYMWEQPQTPTQEQPE